MSTSTEQAQEFARDHHATAGDETTLLAMMLWSFLPDFISTDPHDDNYVDTRGLAEQSIAALDIYRTLTSPSSTENSDG